MVDDALERLKRIVLSDTSSEKEAIDLVTKLLHLDWGELVEVKQSKIEASQRVCQICNGLYILTSGCTDLECLKCIGFKHREEIRVAMQCHRARQRGLPATLTVEQWRDTDQYFRWSCAYCLIRPSQVIEHYLPIELGGGTTIDNCVPACHRCNRRKGSLHPDAVTSIPRADMLRVHEYLSKLKTGIQTP